MKSWEVIREALNSTDSPGAKAIGPKMGLSKSMVYKWTQPPKDERDSSAGAANPLDRVVELYDLTKYRGLINWICQEADGFFVANPRIEPDDAQREALSSTQQLVTEFGDMLAEISRSVGNDGIISKPEAARIRKSWERLKGQAEQFVVGCERGQYGESAKNAG